MVYLAVATRLEELFAIAIALRTAFWEMAIGPLYNEEEVEGVVPSNV